MLGRLKKRLTALPTLWALGPRNLARVGGYRLGMKTGFHPVLKLDTPRLQGPFFSAPVAPPPENTLPRESWQEGVQLYFGRPVPGSTDPDTPPDWHKNPFGGDDARAPADLNWWQIPDFQPRLGDVKTVWEASRFDWIIAFATRAAHGDEQTFGTLEAWLADWVEVNPPYRGANWKCGQEASIRVMHLALAARILGQGATPLPAFRDLIRLHLRRIAPTLSYAVGQANNHGTSEAAALFIGGILLADKEGDDWAQTGRQRLEERAQVLIEPDGTFSQYSVVYHRLMLDTYSQAELWRRSKNLPPFDDLTLTRLAGATRWLMQMTDPQTGNVPNLGANDGAEITVLSDAGTRDFRPSVQLAAVLFLGQRAYTQPGPWDQPLLWQGVAVPEESVSPLESESFDHGGYHILRTERAVAYLRYPRYRFRPGQADALHLDLWRDGRCLLGDAGTYSYNSTPEDSAYFSGTASHNTVSFDGRDQMPRLGRFLFGNWLKAIDVEAPAVRASGKIGAAAAYRDTHGAQHNRTVLLSDTTLTCIDLLEGPFQQATLRWRLPEGPWRIEDGRIAARGAPLTLHIATDGARQHLRLVTGQQSLRYLEKTETSVIEATIDGPATITSTFTFNTML